MKEETGQEPVKSMKEKIYELKRNIIKRKLTNNLGRVLEEEGKLICYVKKNNCKQDKYNVVIPCCGITQKDKELAKNYNLDKPIVYVLDSIKILNKSIYIFGYQNCEVIIKNCNFGFDLNIHINGKCTLENTHINPFNTLCIGADELSIKDMSITNPFPYANNNFKIYIGAEEKLEINNSTIGDVTSKVNISARNNLHVFKSTIYGKEVACKATNMIFGKKSNIIATKKVEIERNNFGEINITSPTIISNGHTLDNLKTPIILRKTKDKLKIKRIELIDMLNKIKNKVIDYNQERINEYQTTLESKPISRVLSK